MRLKRIPRTSIVNFLPHFLESAFLVLGSGWIEPADVIFAFVIQHGGGEGGIDVRWHDIFRKIRVPVGICCFGGLGGCDLGK